MNEFYAHKIIKMYEVKFSCNKAIFKIVTLLAFANVEYEKLNEYTIANTYKNVQKRYKLRCYCFCTKVVGTITV